MDEEEERSVAAWYDALSKGYDELYGPEQALKERLVLDLIARRRFSLLVDVGCGPGNLLRDAVHVYDFAIGIDLSRKMLNEAKKKKSTDNDLVLATSRFLPIRDDCVECVVSISTLKADSTLRSTLAEFLRVRGKNAMLAFSLFGEPKDELLAELSNSLRSSRVSDRESVFYANFGERVDNDPGPSTTLG